MKFKGLRWWVIGLIALATVIIQFFGNIYLAYHVIKSNYFEFTFFKEVKIKWTYVKNILGQGIPATLNMATIALGVFIINYFCFIRFHIFFKFFS